MSLVTEEIHEAIFSAVRADTKRLERLCASALVLQHPDYVDRLTVIEFTGDPWGRTVGSLL